MDSLTNNLFNIQLLLESGGTILWMILIASILMWTLLIERYLFVYFIHPSRVKELLQSWDKRQERSSWYAYKIREGMIAQSGAELKQHLMSIRTLIAALPMLGLLGTVDGMIQTFDVLTVFGTGNARGMAGGISIALITTMGGLLAALSGMYFSTQLDQRVTRSINHVAELLRRD
ncbi:MAG: biopolymer transporter ExbB [Gammaproteobacteria bacterium]|nr:MAG: biopolymer transporter ExbB [Gammaproteobacteria bacterium]